MEMTKERAKLLSELAGKVADGEFLKCWNKYTGWKNSSLSYCAQSLSFDEVLRHRWRTRKLSDEQNDIPESFKQAMLEAGSIVDLEDDL
jgi:hypothetical protein